MEEQTRMTVSPEIIKSQKTLTCSCGGMIFIGGVVFKKLSPLISPSGKEQLFPIEVLMCQKCGKVPEEFNEKGFLSNEVLSKTNLIK